jgi:uncharacterized lipoprotein YbaY/heat shock protein HslJ/uncharacterized lipoprotein NlpE involved in copper resistance
MLLAGSLLLLAAAAPESIAITGTATYRERIALPRSAVFEATLEDVSRADAPATVVARQRLSPAGSPPFAVRIPYNPARIQASRRYVVRATLWAGTAMRWTTDTVVPVLTRGAGTTVELRLERVPPPAAPTGTFEGVLPCADCPGIQHRLTLLADQTYHLRTEYQDRPDGVFDEIGSLAVTADGSTLVLEGGPAGARYFAIAGPDRLTQLDTIGDPIATAANLDLVRAASPAPVEPRLALHGLFSTTADAPVLEECRTRQKMPVAREGDYEALESAYTAKRPGPGQTVYAVVEGRVASRVPAKGAARPTVVVGRLVELRPGASCPPRFAAASLESTYWRLVELDGAPLPPAERPQRREAHLMFGADPRRVIGADGCNGMVGEYEADDARLKLDKLAGTKMACPDAGGRDQQFRQALARTSGYRVLGPELQLRDKDGAVLARFAAVPRAQVPRAR